MGKPVRRRRRALVPGAQARAARRSCRGAGRPAGALRRRRLRGRRQPGRDQPARRRPREHGARPRPPACRCSSSATSTAAACSPRCSARSRCSSPPTRRTSPGFVINKFRGDPRSSRPASSSSRSCTGRPTLGVLPYVEDLWLDVEDSLALEAPRAEDTAPAADTLDVAVVRLRWMSNFTDLDALAAEPGVRVRFTRSTADVERADLVVAARARRRRSRTSPGCAPRARRGAHRAGRPPAPRSSASAAATRCSASASTTTSSPGAGVVAGLGLLPVDDDVRAREGAAPARAAHSALLGTDVGGYEIRHGRVALHGGEPLLVADDGEPEGCVAGAVARHLVARRSSSTTRSAARCCARRRRPRPALQARARRVRRGARAPARRPRRPRRGAPRHRPADHLIEDGVPSQLPAVESDLRAWDAR